MSLLRYKDYQGAVEFDEGRLVLRLLHIDDLITTEIDSASEAQAAFVELVDDYLASCVEMGKQPSKPFKGSFNVRVNPNLHKQAAFAATEEGETLNAFVTNAIENKLLADFRHGATTQPIRLNATGFLRLSLVTCSIELVSATKTSHHNLYEDGARSASIVDIDHFVPRNEIDHLYFGDPYFVIPDGTQGQDAYAVIRESIRSLDKVAIAYVTSSKQHHVIALEARQNGLLGVLLRHPREVENASRYFDRIPEVKITEDMIDLAKHIVDQKSKTFDPNTFPDQVMQSPMRDEKSERQSVETNSGGNVINLMEALKESLHRDKALRSQGNGESARLARKTD